MRMERTTVRTRHLGSTLARVFRDNEILAQDIAERMGWSPARVSRLLHGRCRITPNDLATVLALCGVSSGELRSMLLELAGDLMSPTWLQEHGERLPVELPAVTEIEGIAARIVCVDGTTVPALLRALGYMHAVLQFNPMIPQGEIVKRADVMVQRQQVLRRTVRPPVVEAFLGAQVLSPNGLSHAVLAEQITHLMQLDCGQFVQLRIVPEDVPVCTPFQLMRFAEAEPVVYVEHLNSTLLTQRATTVAGYQRIVAHLDERALSTVRTRGFLAEAHIALRSESR